MSFFSPKSWFSRSPVVPVLRLSGPIGINSPFQPGLNLSSLAEQIEKAFSIKKAKAVALQINSPGGSPVQSKLIFNRIRALSEENDIPVYSFVEDVAASGGYWLALAGDEVYADDSSILGSIGVISAGFGFDKAIKKIGIDRRVYTAGERKMSLDPFQPENPDEIKRLKLLQKDIHNAFRSLVENRRGDKIREAGDMLFTGEFWSGTRAVELGLIDGLGDLRSILREKFGDEVNLKLIQPKRGLFRRAGISNHLPASQNFTTGLTDDLISTLESRALWAKFGL
jgi:signal peptide peptidase SppA